MPISPMRSSTARSCVARDSDGSKDHGRPASLGDHRRAYRPSGSFEGQLLIGCQPSAQPRTSMTLRPRERRDDLMGLIDQSKCPLRTGSIYPEPYASQMAGRSSLRLGDAAGLTQFGANLVIVAARRAVLAPALAPQRGRVRDGHRGRAGPRPGRGRVPDAPRRLRRLARRRQQRPLLPEPQRPRGALPRRRLASRRDEVVTYSDVDFAIAIEDGAPRFRYRDGTPWTGPR